jgi:hypothetical protein
VALGYHVPAIAREQEGDKQGRRQCEQRHEASYSEVAVPQHLNSDPRQHRKRERDDGSGERRKNDELRGRQSADPPEDTEVVDLGEEKAAEREEQPGMKSLRLFAS